MMSPNSYPPALVTRAYISLPQNDICSWITETISQRNLVNGLVSSYGAVSVSGC